MVIYRCTNSRCPRFTLRTEKICQAAANDGVGHCGWIARPDRS